MLVAAGLLLLGVGVAAAPRPDVGAAGAKPPTMRLSREAGGVFEVVGLDPAVLARLANAEMKADQWSALFAVHVGAATDRPAMLGTYQVKNGVLRFVPRFSLKPGLQYRAVFDPARLPAGQGKPVTAEFTIPKPPSEPSTVVQHVYPSTATLPENQLKFYLHFSAPMSRGEAYRHIRLLDAAGKAVDLPFLELDEELWDPPMKRFTLFFDPGRIKRGLKPREEVGPVLEEGKSYTLVIDRAWPDAEGNPLKESFQKKLRAGPPEDRPVDPQTWKLQPPPAGTSEPLTVRFPRPLDHALLGRVMWVIGADGRRLDGTVSITDEETRWYFTPKQPWQAGAYRLVAETTLEDLAGNRIGRPFEVDVLRPVQRGLKAETVQLPFQVGR